MTDIASRMAITVTHGPSLRVPFAAVIGEFELPASAFTAAADISRWAEWLPANVHARIAAPEKTGTLPQRIMQFARAITEAHGRMELPGQCGTNGQRGWVALGYHDAPATEQAMRLALEASTTSPGTADTTAALRRHAAATLRAQALRQPDYQERAMIRAARRHGIPVFPVVGGSRIWQYGHGSKGWQCFEASTHADSRTGVMLQRNKMQSNELVRQLGLPGVEHRLATGLQQAIAQAGQLGYPLVVKPVRGGKGKGVSAGLRTPQEVSAAFRKAAIYSQQVLVERFIPGDDHRIMVTGGKFQWVVRRMPPDVTGDGKSSVAQLIAQKNARITEEEIDKGFVKRVAIDDELLRTLAQQHVALEDCPPAGTAVRLRGNANVSTGGSFVDVTNDIHADNRAMAETIARAFRLDSVGIDFLTPDIGRSWREGHGAVIEINATPGQLCDAFAERLIKSKFPEDDRGRIPSVILLCDTPAARNGLFSALTGLERGVGTLTCSEARLDGFVRVFARGSDAGTAARALLLDPACKALVAICTLNEIRQRGLPMDRFGTCMWTEDTRPDHALHELLNAFCNHTTAAAAETVIDTLRNMFKQTTTPPA